MATTISTLTGACKKSDPPPAVEEISEPAPLLPAEAEGAQQLVQEKAAAAGQTPEQTRESLVKEEIITEYASVIPASRQVAHVNPDGRICWPAMMCTNPDCPGKGKDGNPFLFAYHYRSATVGADGKLILNVQPLVLLGTCPACFKTNTVEAYLPPDERKRFEEITRRIMKKARENAVITQSRLLTSEEAAEFRQLQREQADMPVYYLCP